MAGPLGMRRPVDNEHVEKYPLRRANLAEFTKPTPVVLGINWYTLFDHPQAVLGPSGRPKYYIVDSNPAWGQIRGGHAICVKPPSIQDNVAWWSFYDQGNEGACVGFSSARMMTLLNRRRYSGESIYALAQSIDDWDDTPPEEGTSVRAGMDVLRKLGAPRNVEGVIEPPNPDDGIAANRWAGSVEEIAWCLSPSDQGKSIIARGYVELLNSWGRPRPGLIGYPHTVRLSLDGLHRLVFQESGEATVITDR